MKKLTLFLFLILLVIGSKNVSAHPGRTDSSGGHTCRTNCENWGYGYGEYHSHNGGIPSGGSSTSTAPVAPVVQNPTRIPTVMPTKIATPLPKPKAKPYKETLMDKKKMFRVESITDGDTFRVSIRGNSEPVRMVGIDTPESLDPRTPVQCFSKEATNKLSSLIKGKYVRLVDDRTQGNRDKYKRLLRFVYLEDGTFVNAEMVKQGYAYSYKQFPHPYLNQFNSFEKQAREKELGLWNKCV